MWAGLRGVKMHSGVTALLSFGLMAEGQGTVSGALGEL